MPLAVVLSPFRIRYRFTDDFFAGVALKVLTASGATDSNQHTKLAEKLMSHVAVASSRSGSHHRLIAS